MKLNKLLITGTAFVLGLSACNGAGSKVKPLSVYEVEGTSIGFPTQVVNDFLAATNASYTIPALGDDTLVWEYSAGPDLYYCCNTLCLATVDNGTPGTDALEDAYCVVLAQANIAVDDSQYDLSGYCVLDENDEVLFNFYSYDGYFILNAYVYGEPSEEFPTDYLNSFLKLLKVKANVPAPVSENDWFYIASNVTFYAYTVDNGTPGTNAIEDSYKATLANAGWEIDDTYYEDEGYYATKGELEICFYSYDGYFEIYIYLQVEATDNSEIK